MPKLRNIFLPMVFVTWPPVRDELRRWVSELLASRNGGVSVQSASGGTTFNIPHGLNDPPSHALVTPGSVDARGAFHVTMDATNVTVNYASAPASGTDNLTFYWRAWL